MFDARSGAKVLRSEIEELRPGATYLVDVAYSPDGRLVAVAGTSAVVVSDARTGEELMRLGEPLRGDRRDVFDRPFAVAFTPDGKRLVAGWGAPGRVYVWDTTPGAAGIPAAWLTAPPRESVRAATLPSR